MNKYLIILLLGLSQIVYGQDASKNKSTEQPYKKSTVMRSIKALMKATNYSKVLEETNNAFNKHNEANDDPEIHHYQVKALEQLILAENRKMYLETKPDTAKYFGYLYQMYIQALICDSLEQIPDLNGKVSFKYRYTNADALLKYRQNLRASCNYFYKKKDYKQAFLNSDMYIRSKNATIFTGKKGENRLPVENDMTSISVMATLSAYGSQNYKGVTSYYEEAMNDANTRYKILELASKSYLALNDTAKHLELCLKGFNEKPDQEYFFMSLIKYNIDQNNHKECLHIANQMVAKFPEKRNYWFIKAKEEEIGGLYDSAIESYQKAIELKEDDAEAYSYMGVIYTNKAQDLYNTNTLSVTNKGYKEFKANLKALYVKAKDAYELARKYAPENSALWYEGLKNTYFKLNMGRELKALEELK